MADAILLQDQKSQNTAGGDFTSGAWRTRVLNTEVVDSGNNCTLSSNQFTLAAGDYEIWATAPVFAVGQHQTRLYNTTGTTTVLTGGSSDTNSASFSVGYSVLKGRFTIAAGQALELQHRCTTDGLGTGFGQPANFGTEVYAQVFLRKV